MSLKVIGSGLGRTGTTSLKLALEQLGFGPCHHMSEMFAHPEAAPLWTAAAEGRPDFPAMLAGYQAVVDYPGCVWWRELAALYPQAKVVHTIRDPDEWFDSTQATIFAAHGKPAKPEGPLAPFFEAYFRELRPHLHDRAWMTDYFRRYSGAVIAGVSPERLLVYETRQGWGPLCAFLGVSEPATPFPSENSRAVFINKQGA